MHGDGKRGRMARAERVRGGIRVVVVAIVVIGIHYCYYYYYYYYY